MPEGPENNHISERELNLQKRAEQYNLVKNPDSSNKDRNKAISELKRQRDEVCLRLENWLGENEGKYQNLRDDSKSLGASFKEEAQKSQYKWSTFSEKEASKDWARPRKAWVEAHQAAEDARTIIAPDGSILRIANWDSGYKDNNDWRTIRGRDDSSDGADIYLQRVRENNGNEIWEESFRISYKNENGKELWSLVRYNGEPTLPKDGSGVGIENPDNDFVGDSSGNQYAEQLTIHPNRIGVKTGRDPIGSLEKFVDDLEKSTRLLELRGQTQAVKN